MNRHRQYLNYVLRHKLYVFRAGWKLKVPLWRLIIHDWSKFLPDEWFAYVNFFYPLPTDPEGPEAKRRKLAFDKAWWHHQHRHDHHWQYWLVINDWSEPKIRPIEMSDDAVREMVADWVGAGLAQGDPDIGGWYRRMKEKIIIHEDSRWWVELYLHHLGYLRDDEVEILYRG